LQAMSTCPVAAAKAEDDLLLKNNFFEFFKIQWLHFRGKVDKFVTTSCVIFSRFYFPKIIKIGSF